MTKFVFKKIKDVQPDDNVRIMDKREGSLQTNQESAIVDYLFQKPDGFDCPDEHSIRLTIDNNYFTAEDLAEFISFLTAAQQRLIKQNSRMSKIFA